jgi:hypothetical protein
MAQITVPFAATWLRIYISIFLAIGFLAGTRFSIKNLIACVQIGRGAKPLPPYLPSQKFAQAGMVIFGILTIFSVFCGYVVLLLLTSGPTTLTDQGITQGGRPPYYRQTFVAWSDVARVNCFLSRRGQIRELDVYSSYEEKIGIGNAGTPLEDVRSFIGQHVPASAVRPCVYYSGGRRF